MKIKIHHLREHDAIPVLHDSQGRRVRIVKYTAERDGYFVVLENANSSKTLGVGDESPQDAVEDYIRSLPEFKGWRETPPAVAVVWKSAAREEQTKATQKKVVRVGKRVVKV